MTTWRRGREVLVARRVEGAMDNVLASVCTAAVPCVPGIAVYPHPTKQTAPLALRATIDRFHVVHERVVVLTGRTTTVPHVPWDQRLRIEQLGMPGERFIHITAEFGFQDPPDFPAVLRRAFPRPADPKGADDPDAATCLVTRLTLHPTRRSELSAWRTRLFIALTHHAAGHADFLYLPTDRTVLMGAGIDLLPGADLAVVWVGVGVLGAICWPPAASRPASGRGCRRCWAARCPLHASAQQPTSVRGWTPSLQATVPRQAGGSDQARSKLGIVGSGDTDVNVDRSVEGDRLMRADGVVVDPVGLGVGSEGDRVVDVLAVEPLVLQGAEAAFAGAVLARGADSGADVVQLGSGSDERLEGEGPERPAVVGDARDGPELAGGGVGDRLGQ
jgi:potassium transporter